MASTYTYDLSDVIGQIRLQIGDTDVSESADTARWSDEELWQFYYATSDGETSPTYNITLAAANALEAEASSAARLANIIRLGTFGDNESTVEKALSAKAARLRTMAGMCTVNPPNPIFTLPRSSVDYPTELVPPGDSLQRGSMWNW